MDPPNRKRHYYEHQQMEANGEVNGINHYSTANGNNNNNINNNEESGWKMAALEARNRLELTMENHGLKAENIALKGKNRTLEAEQTVQQENAEKLGEFLQKMMAFQEQSRMDIAVLKEENLTIWRKLKEAEQKEEQQRKEIAVLKEENLTIWRKLKEMEQEEERQRKEIAEQKVLNQAGTKALWRQLKEAQQKLETNIQHNLEEFAKRMEHKHEQEIADIKVENLQLSENIQMDEQMREFGKKLALLEEEKRDTIRWDQIKSTILWPFLVKDRRLLNPQGNVWNPTKTKAQISADGLGAISSKTSNDGWHNVFASQRFGISAAQCRQDFYPGTILYYFEVTRMSASNWAFYIGLSNGHIPDNLLVCTAKNGYCFPTRMDHCYIGGTQHHFEWPTDVISRPEWNGIGDTLGCGILLNPKNELAIFFTANGILMGKQIPLTLPHPCDFLTPFVSLREVPVEANFGHDLANKPFKYDIEKWPGLVFQPCTNI